MEQIRQGVFETNSSSTHSLVILTDRERMECYKNVLPEVYAILQEKFSDKNCRVSDEEIVAAFKKIRATIKKGVLDLRKVKPVDYDFGYTEAVYGDPAHKILLALACDEGHYADDYYYDYDNDEYSPFHKRLYKILNEHGIASVIMPKNGLTGIDHQCREDLIYSIKYDLENFILRKDYILMLDHD